MEFNMKNSILHLLSLSLGLAAALSCSDDLQQMYSSEAVSGREVAVTLDLSIADESSNTPRTKAVDDPSGSAAPQIRNICVLQYDGKDEDSRLVGDVHYFSISPEDGNVLDDIRLTDSNGAEHTLVILANTFARIPKFETLGTMLSQTRMIDCEADLLGHEGQGEGYPDDADYYQRLNGLAVSVVSEGVSLKAKLRRSMARLNIHVSNTGKDGLIIKSIQVRNVPKRDYYITDYRYNASDVLTLRSEAFHDGNDPLHLIDYPADVLEYNPGEAQSQDFTHYVTCNMRGTIVNEDPSMKNKLCVDGSATRLDVLGFYGPEHDKPIQYSFYLGADLKQDFNINPNTAYDYEIKFDGKGNIMSDSRITDFGGIDFEVDSNCYLLNPPLGGESTYTFNVVHRPNLFWGERYGHINETEYANNYMYPTDKWYARIIWSDFEMSKADAEAFLAVRQGDASGSYIDPNQRITVKVPANCPGGNVLVGIYKNPEAPEQILWSWHLWITGYVPDRIFGVEPTYQKYIYYVPSGQVHRYSELDKDGKSSVWAAGNRYEKAFIMDRAVGSTSDTDADAKAYQYGRKDPFNGNIPVWTYDSEFNPTRVTGNDGKDNGMVSTIAKSILDAPSQIVDGKPNGGMNTGGKNVPYSVSHPTTFITGNGKFTHWTSSDVFSVKCNWNDPTPSERTTYEEISSAGQENKSFFDPCPPGWRLPAKGTASVPQSKIVYYGNAGSQCFGYYPLAAPSGDASEPLIKFYFLPMVRDSSTGKPSKANPQYWTGQTNDITNRFYIFYNGKTFETANSSELPTGRPVRCIHED